MSDALRDQTKAAYDTVAARYVEMLPDTRVEAGLDLAMVGHLIDHFRDDSNAQILDAGCAAGRMITCLRSRNQSVELAGVDLSPRRSR